jgi:RNA polymerase sigma-70 factor (ECF subfamily)
MDEQRMIAAAQRGDVTSFDQLVRAYQGNVYQTAYRVLGDASAAADATQDAFINAYKNIRLFRGGSFRAWLLRIVTNCCYDLLRMKRHRQVASLEALLQDCPNAEERVGESRDESPPDFAERLELGSMIQKGLQTMPVEQRVTLILADIQGFSYVETAQITGVNVGTVKSRLSRARAYLREFLLAQEELLPTSYHFRRAARGVKRVQAERAEDAGEARVTPAHSRHLRDVAT